MVVPWHHSKKGAKITVLKSPADSRVSCCNYRALTVAAQDPSVVEKPMHPSTNPSEGYLGKIKVPAGVAIDRIVCRMEPSNKCYKFSKKGGFVPIEKV